MKNSKKSNRRTKRRPRDDRVRKIRLTGEGPLFLMTDVLTSGISRVRDSRLQSIRFVGGDTPTMKVLLVGNFVANENVTLGVIQKNPLKLDRTLTLPRRVRDFFVDSIVEGSDNSGVVITGFDPKMMSYLEFTFLTESPPVYNLGLNSCNTPLIIKTEAAVGATKLSLVEKLPADTLIGFEYGDTKYLCQVSGAYDDVVLIYPTTVQTTIPQDIVLDYKFE